MRPYDSTKPRKDIAVLFEAQLSSKQGKSDSSVNILSSMISMTQNFNPAGRTDVDKHPLVVRLVRGMFNARPATPKYSHTWDPTVELA